MQGAVLLDAETQTAGVVAAVYAGCVAQSWSSKTMLQLIRRKAALLSPDEQPSSLGSTVLGESQAYRVTVVDAVMTMPSYVHPCKRGVAASQQLPPSSS